LFEEQSVVGTLTIYAREPNFFDEEEQRLLTELAGDISFALANIRRQQKLDKLARIQTYHSTVFARFLERLKNIPDGDGSLLDHSILLYGSNMGNSDLHDANLLPSAVFGHAYGRIKGGQHVACAADTPLANLLLTLLERGGIAAESLGNSSGLLSEV